MDFWLSSSGTEIQGTGVFQRQHGRFLFSESHKSGGKYADPSTEQFFPPLFNIPREENGPPKDPL